MATSWAFDIPQLSGIWVEHAKLCSPGLGACSPLRHTNACRAHGERGLKLLIEPEASIVCNVMECRTEGQNSDSDTPTVLV